MSPRSIPNVSWTTLAAGARQFVVQLALLITWWLAGSYLSSLTPSTTVMSSPFAGALMITFRAPAWMWARAFSASVKMPVDSRTMSTPMSPHGNVLDALAAFEDRLEGLAPNAAEAVDSYANGHREVPPGMAAAGAAELGVVWVGC